MHGASMDLEKESQLRPIVAWFICATSWKESRQLVEKYPMLLSDEAMALVKALTEQEMRMVPDNAWFLVGQCAFLRRCREVGTVKAYDEMLRKEKSKE